MKNAKTALVTAIIVLFLNIGISFASIEEPMEEMSTVLLADYTFDNDVLPTSIRVIAGSPEIINGQLHLQSQNEGREQIGIDLGGGFDRYLISFQVTAQKIEEWKDLNDSATFLLDVPKVNTTNWQSGRIYHRDYAHPFSLIDEDAHTFFYELDFSREEDWLTIYMDDVMVYDDILINSEGDLSSIRFGITGTGEISIDNLKIQGINQVPIPSTCLLLISGFLGIVNLRRKKE